MLYNTFLASVISKSVVHRIIIPITIKVTDKDQCIAQHCQQLVLLLLIIQQGKTVLPMFPLL